MINKRVLRFLLVLAAAFGFVLGVWFTATRSAPATAAGVAPLLPKLTHEPVSEAPRISSTAPPHPTRLKRYEASAGEDDVVVLPDVVVCSGATPETLNSR